MAVMRPQEPGGLSSPEGRHDIADSTHHAIRLAGLMSWLGAFLLLFPVFFPRLASGEGPVVAFLGDSLTAGYTLPAAAAYPAFLARSLGITAINAGVNGDTTAGGLARLDRDILAYRPRIVVVELGINDHIRRLPAAQSLQNLEEIARRVRQTGAHLVLLHVRPPVGQDQQLPGFRSLARRYEATLVEDLLRGIIGDPSLVEGIHPNALGQQKIADRLRPILSKMIQAF